MLTIYSLLFTVLLSPLAYGVYGLFYRAVIKFDLHRPIRAFFLIDDRGMVDLANTESVEEVGPSQLKPHPVNQEVYREGEPPENFVKSVEENGIRDPVMAKEDGTIISGHRRWMAAKEVGIKVPVQRVSYDSELEEERAVIELNRQREKTFSQKMREAEKLEEIEREKAKKRQGERTDLGDDNITQEFVESSRSERETNQKVADQVDLGSRETYRKAKKVWEKAKEGDETAQAQIERLDKGKTTIHNAYKYVKREEHHEEVKERIEDVPEGKYNVILADPPWGEYWSLSSTRDVENQYPTMSLEEIKDVDVPADDDAILFLWATAPGLPWALEVMEAWGFEYVTNAAWDKEEIGMGYWFRGQHEHLLVGKKGDFSPPKRDERVSSVIREKRTEHSAKPERVYEIIETYFPDAERLELFARGEREGWTLWGPEAGLKPEDSGRQEKDKCEEKFRKRSKEVKNDRDEIGRTQKDPGEGVRAG